jgi:4-amino-4-deoxy-L-arabinose transferase-like glycosyltransferase
MASEASPRPRSTLLTVLLLWIAFYASFTLFVPPLLDDADSVHVEVAREMLLRHDYITLYANGVRYLEKAPLLYWSMALCMKLFGLFGVTSPRILAAAARIPLALAVLGLALLVENFARSLFGNDQRPSSRSSAGRTPGQRAGLYAALITLSSFGIFLFSRITIPDVGTCLWTALAMLCFWRTEALDAAAPTPALQSPRLQHPRFRWISFHPSDRLRLYCGGFAAACALNVLTKGLIGVVFPAGIVLLYLLATRGFGSTLRRLRELHPWASAEVFLLIAAPWHILAGLANPTQGHPTPFHFVHGHWIVPLPSDGNVRGWFWFYFMNEHVLRYLNLRVPHDYDTSPLWLFWGLCLVWMLPWSAFGFKAAGWALPWRDSQWRHQLREHTLPHRQRALLLLVIWAAFVLLFFAFSTRQEYYVLPALPAMTILIACWLAYRPPDAHAFEARRRAARRALGVLLALGFIYLAFAIFSLLHTRTPAPDTDLATLLQQNPADYALSMGHFLDLNAQSLGLFRLPLTLSALSLFLGPLAALLLRRRGRDHAANLALAGATFVFLLAAHLALQTFAPVLTSAQLARAIAPQLKPQDMIAIHGEYESGSSLGFYLNRPLAAGPAASAQDIHILEGRSSNLWYGSFFPDSPRIFETPDSFARKWAGPQRIFLWQSLTDPPNQLPPLNAPVYVVAKSGGKEIVSNRPSE